MVDEELGRRRLAVPEGVCVQELGGELALLNVETGMYFGLDEQGKAFFDAMTQESSLEAALAKLRDAFDVANETLKADFLEMIDRLQQHGLIEEHDS